MLKWGKGKNREKARLKEQKKEKRREDIKGRRILSNIQDKYDEDISRFEDDREYRKRNMYINSFDLKSQVTGVDNSESGRDAADIKVDAASSFDILDKVTNRDKKADFSKAKNSKKSFNLKKGDKTDDFISVKEVSLKNIPDPEEGIVFEERNKVNYEEETLTEEVLLKKADGGKEADAGLDIFRQAKEEVSIRQDERLPLSERLASKEVEAERAASYMDGQVEEPQLRGMAHDLNNSAGYEEKIEPPHKEDGDILPVTYQSFPKEELPPVEGDYEDIEDKAEEIKEDEIERPEEIEVIDKLPYHAGGEYHLPPIDLLNKPAYSGSLETDEDTKKTAELLRQTLATFKVKVTVTGISKGPTVTRYEIQPEMGTKVKKITNLADDIKLNLAVADIRIEAPIPGKSAIGIEVPNDRVRSVSLRELMESKEFKENKSLTAFAAGEDISGRPVIAGIEDMPHLLVAGATGAGKSVCINAIIMSILYRAKPDEVKMIMVDPKVVELSVYSGIPHLLVPVVTDPKKAAGALNWAVAEMDRRYKNFEMAGSRNLKDYNKKVASGELSEDFHKMPQILIIVDELADLMMAVGKEVEAAICRLAQKARAAGIHLIIATQRPSVDVITGLIKANIPSRIAFAVSSGTDSRTIIDMTGAEKLLGKGDMLYFPKGIPKPLRVQGAFVSDDEVMRVVDFVKEEAKKLDNNGACDTLTEEEVEEEILEMSEATEISGGFGDDTDELFEEAARLVIERDKASAGMLQRYFRVGFNRASRIIEQLSEAGVVGPEIGTKPRKVLMNMEEFEEMTGSRE